MEDFAKCYNNGDIVVVANTTNEMVPYLKTASGIIVGGRFRLPCCNSRLSLRHTSNCRS